MKKIFTLVLGVCLSIGASAQIGAVAPDFTVTDIDGNSHTLYEYLDDGKVVILDVSAVWCGPCWNFHQGHYLEELYHDIGQGGTNQAVILFYEGDANTDNASLSGNGGGSLGDWLDGTSYPFINESPLSLSMSVYAPEGFPTVNIINPADKKIVADVWNYTSTASIKDLVDDYFLLSTEANGELFSEVSVYPNPTQGATTLNISSAKDSKVSVEIVNLTGQTLLANNYNVVAGTNNIALDLSTLSAGQYIANIRDEENNITSVRVQLLD